MTPIPAARCFAFLAALIGALTSCIEAPPKPPVSQKRSAWLADTTRGNPEVQAIDALAFGGDGVLFIADSVGRQLIGVETNDTNPADANTNRFVSIGDLSGKLVQAFGGAEAMTVQDIVVNPVSKRVYVGVILTASGEPAIVSLDGDGQAFLFDTADVVYASVPLPDGVARVTDLAVDAKRLVAAAHDTGFTASQVALAQIPLRNGTDAGLSTTRSYHRTHSGWETFAPLDSLFLLNRDDRTVLGGAFMCAPVVRFPIAAFDEGGEVTGETPFDFGGGRQVRDFITYERDGRTQILALVLNLLNATPLAVAQFDADLFFDETTTNEDAEWLFDWDGAPTDVRASEVFALRNAERLIALDDDAVVVLRDGGLETVPLP